VTPTKKAADVARRELGVPADSVAKLVHEHGWRWNSDGVWTRLTAGDTDPDTGTVYTGPSTQAQLQPGERIVGDEAGMLDQDTALALLTVADETGATVALVGDRAQLPAVGRGGVLDMAAQISGQLFDMTTVHRFTDAAYADLTVQLRGGENPALLFDRLHALGLIRLHDTDEAVREHIATSARDGAAITVATNDEAQALNQRIRAERVRRGQVDDTRTTSGSDELPFGAGDVIQTRRNDSQLQVANRQTWTVQHVGDDGTVWAKETGGGRKHQATVRLPAEYVAEHVRLAYASTAYGVQGATTSESHTVLSDALDAAGVYVGMTRGRTSNHLHIVAADLDDAREQFALALERDRADRGLAAATRAANQAIAGLAAHRPVERVNAERARLAAQIKHAEQQTEQWERAASSLDRQRHLHDAEQQEHRTALAAAETHVEQIRAEIAHPLIEQATNDGTAYLASRSRLWEASATRRSARGLGKRGADRAVAAADEAHRTIEAAALRRWGTLPQTPIGIDAWAEDVATTQADSDPRISQAREQADRLRDEYAQLAGRQQRERAALQRKVYGKQPPTSALAQASRWRDRAIGARQALTEIEALPVTEAARLLRERDLHQRAQERAQEQKRQRQRREVVERPAPSPGHRPPPAGRGL
jgi:hypothetical protein